MTDTQIEDLRRAMEVHTATIEPPAGLARAARRRLKRRRVTMAAAALAVAGIVGVSTTVLSAGSREQPAATPQPSASPLSAASPPAPDATSTVPPREPIVETTFPPQVTLASAAPNMVEWIYRGGLQIEGLDTIDAKAGDVWAAKHGLSPAQVLGVPLLGVALSTTSSVLMFEVTQLGAPAGSLAVYIQDKAGARLVYDAPAISTDIGISVRIRSEGKQFVLAVSAQEVSVLALEPVGRAQTPTSTLPKSMRGESWAVFREPLGAAGGAVSMARCQPSEPRCSPAVAIPIY